MLEYCKLILEKISFNRKLFRREYRKSFRYLEPKEHFELKKWLRSRMKNRHDRHELELSPIIEKSSTP